MNLEQTISTLEALASGRYPSTEDLMREHHLFSEQSVRKAFKLAANTLKTNTGSSHPLQVSKADIETALQAFKQNKIRVTAYRFRGFFWGSQKFKDTQLEQHPLYGKYYQESPKDQLLEFFNHYFKEHQPTPEYDLQKEPWRAVDFFEKEAFNLLAISDVERLKKAAAKLGVNRNENLAAYMIKTRENHYRSYEAWTDEENALLRRAMAHTNELPVLSLIFGRTENSIRIKGQQLIFHKKLPTKLSIDG